MSGNDELLNIIEGLASHLEFLEYAGVTELPAVPKADRGEGEAAGEGLLIFGVWRLGPVVFVEGERAGTIGGPEPSTGEHRAKFEGMASWMAGELGLDGFSADDCRRMEFPVQEGCPAGLKEHVLSLSPRVIVALGLAATAALTGGPDVKGARGRFHAFDGVPVMPTHSPGVIVNNKAMNKQTHEDMKKVLERLKK